MAAHSHLINQSSPPLSRNRECHNPHALLGITWRARTRDLVKLDITQTETVNRPEGCSDIRRAPWARFCYFDNFTGGRNRKDWELYSNSSLVVVCWRYHEPLPCRSRVWGREALGARQRGLSATPEIEQARKAYMVIFVEIFSVDCTWLPLRRQYCHEEYLHRGCWATNSSPLWWNINNLKQ